VADYYEILGLEKSATATQIRSAYKRLAMMYHPDRNPGNVHAEEAFKQINEAYHTLSDALKKSRYDTRYDPPTPATYEDYLREQKRSRYYRWQKAQQYSYKIDREYFKIQGLSFLVFIVIAGFCFTIIHAASYFTQAAERKHALANSMQLKKVNALFIAGKFDDAFMLMHTLRENDPLETRFYYAHDSLVSELKRLAEERFNERNFAAAINHYRILETYEDPVQNETIHRISLCQYYLGNYKESLQAMKQLHNQNPDDLVLIYNIGIINLEKLENPKEALFYFSLGKNLFKKNLSEVYGKAFMFVMNPQDAPDIYFDIFEGRARTNLAMSNYHDAKLDCDWAVFLRPEKGQPYYLRALSKIKDDQLGVCDDLKIAQRLGIREAAPLLRKHCR
jgi:tetratricopeptide (TPR) repeat protein